MNHFQSIKELVNTLVWSKDLLVEMFEKRKSFSYKYDYALELLEEDRIETLCLTRYEVFGILNFPVGKCSLLAQLVEHYLDKVGVSSSSLLETTIFTFSIRCLRRTLPVL